MKPVETIPAIWGGGMKVSSGRQGEFKYDIFDTM
jgi:hypothetical protein